MITEKVPVSRGLHCDFENFLDLRFHLYLGLFQRAILQSGSSVSSSSGAVSSARGLRAQQIVASYLNCTEGDQAAVLACMQDRAANEISRKFS